MEAAAELGIAHDGYVEPCVEEQPRAVHLEQDTRHRFPKAA
jgi:hypothetical protein